MTTASFRDSTQTVLQDWQALSRYLLSQGLQFAPEPAPRQFGGGFANLNYLILIDGNPAVLRRPPMGPLPPGAYDMARESKILSRLHERFPLAPRALHLCDDSSVLGAPFQITEYREGLSIRDELPGEWAGIPSIGSEISQLLVDTLSALHGVDPAAVGLEALGRPQGFLKRAVDGWRKRAFLAFDSEPRADQQQRLNALSAWLSANPAEDRAVNLLHNDFKLDNLLLEPASRKPVALLDWDQGTRGDGLFDLATLLSYWVEADDPPALKAMRQMPTAHHGFWSRQQVAEAYAAATGRDLAEFRFHLALARLKTATIFQQLYQRYLSGETRDPRYAEFAGVADALLLQAHDTAHQASL